MCSCCGLDIFLSVILLWTVVDSQWGLFPIFFQNSEILLEILYQFLSCFMIGCLLFLDAKQALIEKLQQAAYLTQVAFMKTENLFLMF